MRGSCLLGCRARPRWRARAETGRAAPRASPLHRRLDGGQRQGGALDDPRGLGHHLARWEEPLGDAPLDHRGTDPQLLGRLGERQRVVFLGEIREPIWIADTRDAVCSPGLARPCPIAQAMERGGNSEVTIALGEFRNHAHDIVIGGTAVRARRIACHTSLSMYAAVPVQTQEIFGWLRGAINHNFREHCAE